jgi:hypothetical protein
MANTAYAPPISSCSNADAIRAIARAFSPWVGAHSRHCATAACTSPMITREAGCFNPHWRAMPKATSSEAVSPASSMARLRTRAFATARACSRPLMVMFLLNIKAHYHWHWTRQDGCDELRHHRSKIYQQAVDACRCKPYFTRARSGGKSRPAALTVKIMPLAMCW